MLDKAMRGKKWIPVEDQPGCGEGRVKLCWSVSAVARECGVSREYLDKRIQDRTIPAPTMEGGPRRYYLPEQVTMVVTAIKDFRNRTIPGAGENWNIKTTAEYLKTSRVVLDWHIAKGNIPTPTRGYHNVLRWTPEQVAEIVKFFEDRKRVRNACWNLEDGLREVGLPQTDIDWAKYHKVRPNPDYIIGNGRRNKWYNRKTLERFARFVRMERMLKG